MKIIDNDKICDELAKPCDTSCSRVREILLKAKELKGISRADVLTLMKLHEDELLHEVYETAIWIKKKIYGNRLVLFAPLYVSNLCQNECLYCAFRKSNEKLVRKILDQDEIREETGILLDQGHKRVLLVAGALYPREGLDYIYNSIETIYSVKSEKGNIRRININIAPLDKEEFKELKKYKIGTYQLFQEIYHEPTYKKMHPKGPKSNYMHRLETMDRGFEAGLDDVGIGALFGLYDWKYETLALLGHISHLEKKFGLGPHTISVPRIEPAAGSEVSFNPPYPVSDKDFKKLIAILRIAVPYTGIILSTRETPEMRRMAFELGVSQISAGSRTNPGGYKHDDFSDPHIPFGEQSQFSLGDTRPVMDVIKDIVEQGFIPSFCTACYRLGRVGKDFMELAKPGLIQLHCLPNAMFTFTEYLCDFADSSLKKDGFRLIDEMIKKDITEEKMRVKTRRMINHIKNGKRDIFF